MHVPFSEKRCLEDTCSYSQVFCKHNPVLPACSFDLLTCTEYEFMMKGQGHTNLPHLPLLTSKQPFLFGQWVLCEELVDGELGVKFLAALLLGLF